MLNLKLKSLMVGSNQPKIMAEFYELVFGAPPILVNEGNEYGWKVGDTYLLVAAHSEINGAAQEPGRILLNFETEQVAEEFERIKAIGANVIQAPYEMDGLTIATFADPDGNYFQLMTPFEQVMGL